MEQKSYIGTAGWSYKDWVNSFYYSSATKEYDWLKFYSDYFNTVEVNSSFYTYIKAEIVKGWIEKVKNNSDFLFSIKLNQDFTHKREFSLQQSKYFEYNLDLLNRAERLGALLMQFPYSFGFNDANINYLSKLFEIFQPYNKILEVRHNSWNNKDAVQFLTENKVSFCAVDQPKVGASLPLIPFVTGNILYLRCHGRNVDGWKESINNFGKPQTYNEQNERYKYLYLPGEITEIENSLREVYDKVKKVFVILNNHPTGYAVANAFEFMYLLNNRIKVKIPDTTLKTFPRLEKIKA